MEALPMMMMLPMMFMMLPMMMIFPLILLPVLTSALQPQQTQQQQQQQSGFNLVELLQGLWNAVPYVLTILALVGAIHAFM